MESDIRVSSQEEMMDDIREEESDEDEDHDVESDGDDEDESDDDRVRSRRKRKAFIPPPPRELPTRTTRGQRLGTVAAALNDDQADEEFWNQEFFAEEEKDEQYETESEPEDRFDADFMDSVSKNA